MRCEDGGKAPMIIRDTGFVARGEREGEDGFLWVLHELFYWEYLFRSGRERKNPKRYIEAETSKKRALLAQEYGGEIPIRRRREICPHRERHVLMN